MSERLTERLENGGVRFSNGEYWNTVYPQNEHCLTDIHRMAIKLCDLEDKIEQGKIVELPFGVGDTLYFIDTLDFEPCKKKGKNGDVCPHLVAEYGFGYFCDQTICGCKKIDCAEVKEIKITDIKEIFEYWFDFGKTVFLDRASAEAKVLEMEGEDNE